MNKKISLLEIISVAGLVAGGGILISNQIHDSKDSYRWSDYNAYGIPKEQFKSEEISPYESSNTVAASLAGLSCIGLTVSRKN